ncbi:hypothetical protein [Actinomadura sp. CNU-125]|uniref:hypothetical protein n=1 Tax=Actinomadura sp. CNU-125 TaxID=1904961 RepID=UPI0021CC95D7|nr:hypothetical protein [Actinomadura sp. CNU-125]
MRITEVARTSAVVAETSGRKAKVAALAACLGEAGAPEAPIVVAYLSGELPQRQIGVGYAALRDAPPPADVPALTVAEVDATFTEIGAVSGKGSVARRKELVAGLLGRATRGEQDFLVRLLAGELRQGALDGLMAEAIAAAATSRPPTSGGRSCCAARSAPSRPPRWPTAPPGCGRSPWRSDAR